MMPLRYLSFFGLRLLTGCLFLVATTVVGQESVFELMGNRLQQADDYYIAGNYKSALSIYEDVAGGSGKPKNIDLRLARCYYFTHAYKKAKNSFEAYQSVKALSDIDQFYYAETLLASGLYEEATVAYNDCFDHDPGDDLLASRIWRVTNIEYLFEDSLKNAVRYIDLNSPNSELSMKYHKSGVVYTSNQSYANIIGKSDTKSEAPFYHLFYAATKQDPFDVNALIYEDIKPFAKNLARSFHVGPLSFFDGESKAVVAMSAKSPNAKDSYPLQLYIAEEINGKWKIKTPLSFNNPAYSYTDPYINETGDKLYFSCEMEDGMGGKDIYFSEKIEGQWSDPVNLGETINTRYDERFPFVSGNALYFSSNGHSGLGGFDLFKAGFNAGDFSGVENMGYPINSGYDDLALSIDSLNRHGFLSSNRREGGLNDDLYEFDLGLQSYPLLVSGKIKFIEYNWMDSTELEPLANVKMVLIDNNGDRIVLETYSDDSGNFSFTIPVYSKYRIRVIGKGLDGLVSFEAPKYARSDAPYEIVVVNDDFKKPE